jgi:hypothetical protein
VTTAQKRTALKKGDLWACPACGRRFAKKNQWHSCDRHTVAQHLRKADPGVVQAYDLLVSQLRKLGPVRIDAVKPSINFANKYHFAGSAIRKNHLRIGFLAEKIIDDERIVRVEKLGPKRVALTVVVRSPDELDDAVTGWLRKAYQLQSH